MEKRQLSPMKDIVFHMLFGEPKNENITKQLIEDVIGEKVEEIELDQNPYLWGMQADDKLGILDIKAKINDSIPVDIEMQTTNKENLPKRILYYWSKMYTKQIKEGDKYLKLNKCISIIFVDFELKQLSNLPAHTKWQIRESKYGRIVLTDDLEINIIEVSKVKKLDEEDSTTKWIKFLQDPYGKETQDMGKKEKIIKEATEKLEEINADERKVRIAELHEKYIMDKADELLTAEHEGIEKGIEKGIKQREKRTRKRNCKKYVKKRHTN